MITIIVIITILDRLQAGYVVGSGLIFKKDFWTDSYSMSKAMGTAIANNFAQTMSVSNMKSAFNSLVGT